MDPLSLLGRAGSERREDGSIEVECEALGEPLRFVLALGRAAAVARASREPIDALVVDARDADAADLLGAGSDGATPRPPVPRARIVAIVRGDADGADKAFALGAARVGSVLVDPSADVLLDRLAALLRERAVWPGRVAVCLAGGGIEGLLYELGVLRALDSFLAERTLVDLDLFCGISAGAMVGAFLANGIGPDEIARGLAGQSARIDPISRRTLFDPNYRELGRRLGRLARDLVTGGSGPRGAVSSIPRAVPSAAFAGKRLRNYLERQLTRPGMSNRFDTLRRPLFVGATEQDTARAVVFGDGVLRDVPVHRAVRASCSLAPFYTPERIGDRYYIDGAFSRTTNMRVAVDKGATLVVIVDPLVPVWSDEPGYVYERGGIYGTMQGLKALINGRFDKAVRAIGEMYPDVAFYLFRPEGDEMRILSGSPMKYFYRREVVEIAYTSTMRKIRAILPQISADFARHGVALRDPADALRREVRPRPPLEPSALGIGI